MNCITPVGRASPWLDVPSDSLFTFNPMEKLSSLGWMSTGSSTALPSTEFLKVGKNWFKVSRSVLGNCYSCKTHTAVEWKWEQRSLISKGIPEHKKDKSPHVIASNQHMGLTVKEHSNRVNTARVRPIFNIQ